MTGWRDGAGTLWTPNNIVNVTMKSTTDKIIAKVTWTRNAEGTHTRMLTMPVEGLSVEPFHFSPPVAGAVAAPINPGQ